MVMSRFEFLVNELMRDTAMPRATKVKLYEARNEVREAAGLDAELSVTDAIMSLNSLGKLMALQGLDDNEQLQVLQSEWSDVDLSYLGVALAGTEIFNDKDGAAGALQPAFIDT